MDFRNENQLVMSFWVKTNDSESIDTLHRSLNLMSPSAIIVSRSEQIPSKSLSLPNTFKALNKDGVFSVPFKTSSSQE